MARRDGCHGPTPTCACIGLEKAHFTCQCFCWRCGPDKSHPNCLVCLRVWLPGHKEYEKDTTGKDDHLTKYHKCVIFESLRLRSEIAEAQQHVLVCVPYSVWSLGLAGSAIYDTDVRLTQAANDSASAIVCRYMDAFDGQVLGFD